MSVRWVAVIAAVLLWSGCCSEEEASADTAGPAWEPIVTPEGWVLATADQDPFSDRPAVVECPDNGYGAELEEFDPAFEVITMFCKYFSGIQPSLLDIEPGDRLQLEIGHVQLIREDEEVAATAHMAVAIGSHVIFEEVIPIPASPRFWIQEIEADFAVPAGAPVFLHVHNHGPNSYRFLGLRRARRE